MFVVVEPGQRSLAIAGDITKLARDIGIPSIYAVANKVRNDEDLAFITEHLTAPPLAGWLPLDGRVVEADMKGKTAYDLSPELVKRVESIARETGLL